MTLNKKCLKANKQRLYNNLSRMKKYSCFLFSSEYQV
jgi:hypothetical protein